MYDATNVFVLILVLLFGYIVGFLHRWVLNQQQKRGKLLHQGSILKGKISEQLAPYLHNWPEDLDPSDTKFIGSPVDFIVFKGMSEKNISEVIFIEVKSGRNYFNGNENSLENAIKEKRVRYVPYHVPSEIFNEK